MTKTESKWLNQLNQFYKRFVDHIIKKRYKDRLDNLFQVINRSHPKIKCTIEVNPHKFLDTKIIQNNGIGTT